MTMKTLNHFAKHCTIIFMMMAVTINAQTDSSADFLNTFWKSPYELNNHTFSLKLEKIYYPGVIAEVLDVNDVVLIKPKPSADLRLLCGTDDTWFDKYDFQPINNSLPTVDILRNKFVIFDYPDGTSENFLLTINDSIPTNIDNHYYKRFSMQFEGEETETDNRYDSESNDITWSFYIVQNEVYLGLTTDDIWRLKGLNATGFKEYVGYDTEYTRYDLAYNMEMGSRRDISSIDCTWKFSENTSYHLVRRRTKWMDNSVRLPCLKLDNRTNRTKYIFLFKMVLQ